MTSVRRKSREGKTPGVLMPKKPAYLMDRSFLHEKKATLATPTSDASTIFRDQNTLLHTFTAQLKRIEFK